MEELKKLANEMASGEKTLMKVLEEAHALGNDAEPDTSHVLSKLIGKNVFMRSVTHHYTGKLIYIKDGFLTIVDAAWIADDGRFNEAMKTGEFSEVEPYPDGLPIHIPLSSLNDIHEWKFPLPRTVK